MKQFALNLTKLVEIFVSVDDFLKEFNLIKQATLSREEWVMKAMNRKKLLRIIVNI